jgi:hypothetical protein
MRMQKGLFVVLVLAVQAAVSMVTTLAGEQILASLHTAPTLIGIIVASLGCMLTVLIAFGLYLPQWERLRASAEVLRTLEDLSSRAMLGQSIGPQEFSPVNSWMSQWGAMQRQARPPAGAYVPGRPRDPDWDDQ